MKGENYKRKLTEHQVREIRRIYADGKLGYYPLGDRFKVSGETVRSIVRRETWKHVL